MARHGGQGSEPRQRGRLRRQKTARRAHRGRAKKGQKRGAKIRRRSLGQTLRPPSKPFAPRGPPHEPQNAAKEAGVHPENRSPRRSSKPFGRLRARRPAPKAAKEAAMCRGFEISRPASTQWRLWTKARADRHGAKAPGRISLSPKTRPSATTGPRAPKATGSHPPEAGSPADQACVEWPGPPRSLIFSPKRKKDAHALFRAETRGARPPATGRRANHGAEVFASWRSAQIRPAFGFLGAPFAEGSPAWIWRASQDARRSPGCVVSHKAPSALSDSRAIGLSSMPRTLVSFWPRGPMRSIPRPSALGPCEPILETTAASTRSGEASTPWV